MDKEQNLIFLKSQILCAEIEMQGMIIANKERELDDKSAAYGEKAFIDLINKYCIGHNTILEQIWSHP